jgi:hypothetical protein
MPRLLPLLALAACGSAEPGAPAPLCDTGDQGREATLSGVISRSADPRDDGRGDVYVALFTEDPVWNANSTEVVAQVRLADVDLGPADATVDYTVRCIPPRAEPYAFFVFLDENGTATEAAPEPDAGDLIVMEGLGAPQAAIPEAADYAQDVVLNLVMPLR